MKRFTRILLVLVVLLLIAGGAIYAWYLQPKLIILDKAERIETFRHMEQAFPYHDIPAAATPLALPRNELSLADFTYEWDSVPQALDSVLLAMEATGFLVLRNDSIIYERYFRGHSENDRHTSWSVAKSVVSTLVGIAVDEGKIESIDDPMEQYLPHLRGSGYEGVSIRHVLQMASGLAFSEDYDDPDSDINQMLYQLFLSFESVKDWIASFPRSTEPGTEFEYQSVNTVALGVLVSEVYGRSLADLLAEKVWQPMGAEYPATWNTEYHDQELAFSFLNATLRDYARFGMVFLHNGALNDQRIVSEEWVRAATRIDSSVAHPARPEGNQYQFQWWIPRNTPEEEFFAAGYMGQIVYVNPTRHVVIVKNGTEEAKHLPMIRALARHVAPLPSDTASSLPAPVVTPGPAGSGY